MKVAALSSKASRDKRPRTQRRPSAFDLSRDWSINYEGLPNTEVIDVAVDANRAKITLRDSTGDIFERSISGLAYVVGRRGSVDYLNADLVSELGLRSSTLISGQTFREAAHVDLEIAKGIFIIGSLTGDSLIRFSFGSCAFVAGRIMQRLHGGVLMEDGLATNGCTEHKWENNPCNRPVLPAMNGFEGHSMPDCCGQQPLDRRKQML